MPRASRTATKAEETAGNGKYECHRGKIYLYRTDNKHRVGRKYDFYRKQGNS